MVDVTRLIDELRQLPPLPEEERRLTRDEAFKMLKEPIRQLFEDGRCIKDIAAVINQKQFFIKIKEQDIRNLIHEIHEEKPTKELSKKPRKKLNNQENNSRMIIGNSNDSLNDTNTSSSGKFTLTPDDPDL